MKSNTPNSERIHSLPSHPRLVALHSKIAYTLSTKRMNITKLEERRLVDGIYYYPAGLHKEQNAAIPAKRYEHWKDTRSARSSDISLSEFIRMSIDRGLTSTMLRDPMDRVVSLYHHSGTGISAARDCLERYQHEDFVLHLSCREADNDQTRRISLALSRSLVRVRYPLWTRQKTTFAAISLGGRCDVGVSMRR